MKSIVVSSLIVQPNIKDEFKLFYLKEGFNYFCNPFFHKGIIDSSLDYYMLVQNQKLEKFRENMFHSNYWENYPNYWENYKNARDPISFIINYIQYQKDIPERYFPNIKLIKSYFAYEINYCPKSKIKVFLETNAEHYLTRKLCLSKKRALFHQELFLKYGHKIININKRQIDLFQVTFKEEIISLLVLVRTRVIL